MNVAIIGSGKVAWHIALAIAKTKDHKVSYIHGRNEKSTVHLARKIKASILSNLNKIPSEIEVIIIAVNDDSISDVVHEISLDYSGIICHSSGATPLKTLGEKFSKAGIFYPLYSFSNKNKLDFQNIPILITSNLVEVKKELTNLADNISKHVYDIKEEDRPYIHLAAVFANNFGNFMMTKCFDILSNRNVDTNIMLPIIQQSGKNWAKGIAKNVQTGPAIRDDQLTIQKHIELIKDDLDAKLYEIITKQIQNYYS